MTDIVKPVKLLLLLLFKTAEHLDGSEDLLLFGNHVLAYLQNKQFKDTTLGFRN